MINLGFIGIGFVAQQCHLPSYESIDGCQIAGISDLNEDLLSMVGGKYNVKHRYTSHRQLLSNNEIDAVVITVPRPLTANLCLEALRAKKKVFIEKPIALNEEKGLEIARLANEMNLPVQVGYMRRFDLGSIELKKRFKDLRTKGKIPKFIKACCYAGDSYASPFGYSKSEKRIDDAISIIEKLPIWLCSKKRNGYENYLNIFSHTLDLLEFIVDQNLVLRDALLDDDGQGISTFKTNQGIPVEVSTMRGKQDQWIESITIVYDDLIMELSLGPAFLRNTSGIVSIKSGLKGCTTELIRPKWSWAFKSQAEEFIRICQVWPYANTNLNEAVNQIRHVKDIFMEKNES